MQKIFLTIPMLLWVFLFVFITLFAQTNSSNDFYENLEKKLSENVLNKELHNLIFVRGGTGEPKTLRSIVSANSKYTKYKNKRVRKIHIQQRDVFDNPKGSSELKRLGNLLHISTYEAVIRKSILFDEYDIVNPQKFATSEKRLNELPFIKNATIEIVPIRNENSFVDVVVITQDKWSKSLSFTATDLWEEFSIGFLDRNLLGLGNTFKSEFRVDKAHSPTVGNKHKYLIKNIDGSFIDATMEYENGYEKKIVGAEVSRGYTQQLKYSGAVGFFEKHSFEKKEENKVVESENKYTDFDVWLGRNFKLYKSFFGFENTSFAVRHIERDFTIQPSGIGKDTLRQYHDIIFFNMWKIGLVNQNFYKSSLVYGFGEREYIPYGDNVEFTYGREKTEFIDRDYAGFSYSTGDFVDKLGYIKSRLSIGAYLGENKTEDQTFKFETLFFSPLKEYKTHAFRWFSDLTYVIGFNRVLEDASLSLTNQDVRGFEATRQGEQKLTFKNEIVDYTPWNLWGFKFTLFSFCDISLLNPNEAFPASGRLNSGVGAGFRIRNENLVINTIQFRFAYFPIKKSGESSTNFELAGHGDRGISLIGSGKPEIVSYQ